jgi:hypothetical protein
MADSPILHLGKRVVTMPPAPPQQQHAVLATPALARKITFVDQSPTSENETLRVLKQQPLQHEVIIVIDDDDGDETENHTNKQPLFATPVSLKKKTPLAQPSSRRGRPITRLVESLRPKLRQLAVKSIGTSLDDKDGFYTLSWEYDESELVSKATTPEINVQVICNRIQLLYEDLACVFTVSGVYIGKSSKLRMGERFSLHREKTREKQQCVAMICVATFSNEDVPDMFLPFEENGEDLALKYERLVMKRLSAVPRYSEDMDEGGGGKVGSGISDGIVYALIVLSL